MQVNWDWEADALSRIPREAYHKLEGPVVKAFLKASQETDWTNFNWNPTEIVCKTSETVPEKMTTEQWKKEQAEDEAISEVIKAITSSNVYILLLNKLNKCTDFEVNYS